MVYLSYLGFACDIELRVTDPIPALHHAIQDALGWDSDHLWCLRIGSKREAHLEWPLSEAAWWSSPSPYALVDGSAFADEVGEYEEDADGEDDEEGEGLVDVGPAAGAEGGRESEDEGDDEDGWDDGMFGRPREDAGLKQLGHLGLRPGDKLTYHFDFGDNHLMPLKVKSMGPPKGKAAKYPRITSPKGKRPRQYSSGWSGRSRSRASHAVNGDSQTAWP
jgi:hypothetical protein